jgi:Mg/Co/Ni transporter MgtE
MGMLGGDLAGYPNGRRVMDDVVTIILRAIAGVTIPLVDHTFTPDGAAAKISDNLTPAANRYISTFPYLGVPLDGYGTPSSS